MRYIKIQYLLIAVMGVICAGENLKVRICVDPRNLNGCRAYWQEANFFLTGEKIPQPVVNEETEVIPQPNDETSMMDILSKYYIQIIDPKSISITKETEKKYCDNNQESSHGILTFCLQRKEDIEPSSIPLDCIIIFKAKPCYDLIRFIMSILKTYPEEYGAIWFKDNHLDKLDKLSFDEYLRNYGRYVMGRFYTDYVKELVESPLKQYFDQEQLKYPSICKILESIKRRIATTKGISQDFNIDDTEYMEFIEKYYWPQVLKDIEEGRKHLKKYKEKQLIHRSSDFPYDLKYLCPIIDAIEEGEMEEKIQTIQSIICNPLFGINYEFSSLFDPAGVKRILQNMEERFPRRIYEIQKKINEKSLDTNGYESFLNYLCNLRITEEDLKELKIIYESVFYKSSIIYAEDENGNLVCITSKKRCVYVEEVYQDNEGVRLSLCELDWKRKQQHASLSFDVGGEWILSDRDDDVVISIKKYIR